MSSTVWNMHNNIISDVWMYLQDNINILLNHVMTDFNIDLVHLSETQCAKMAAMHRFEHSFEIPIKTFDINDTPIILGNETMWQFCTNSLVGLYATLPFKTGEQNLEEGRSVELRLSKLNALLSDFIYDPAQDYDESRHHSIENVVDKILGHAHANSPSFWSHAHRYVASDSVWCEKNDEQIHVHENSVHHGLGNLSFDQLWYYEVLKDQIFSAPDVHENFHVADVLNSCACSTSIHSPK